MGTVFGCGDWLLFGFMPVPLALGVVCILFDFPFPRRQQLTPPLPNSGTKPALRWNQHVLRGRLFAQTVERAKIAQLYECTCSVRSNRPILAGSRNGNRYPFTVRRTHRPFPPQTPRTSPTLPRHCPLPPPASHPNNTMKTENMKLNISLTPRFSSVITSLTPRLSGVRKEKI